MGEDIAEAGHRRALIVGLTGVLVLALLVGWLGVRAQASRSAAAEREMFVQAARRTAINLTTIDYQDSEGDVRRVLDSATGEFYERFSQRAPLIIDTVKQKHSQAISTVSEAGLESQSDDEAQVLVAVNVSSTHLGGLTEPPHELRMRMTVQRVGEQAKVSDVEYVT